MGYMPNFLIGSTVKNDDIVSSFKCGNMGGMRRAKATNTLVIVTNHTKERYYDKWIGDELHYTGMGKIGDQIIDKQNKTLSQSNSNGVELHLFEVFLRTKYTYRGVVYLSNKPYEANQLGKDGIERMAWVFPLKLKELE
jgi:5-methylcytosine-specific restriction enzyme A